MALRGSKGLAQRLLAPSRQRVRALHRLISSPGTRQKTHEGCNSSRISLGFDPIQSAGQFLLLAESWLHIHSVMGFSVFSGDGTTDRSSSPALADGPGRWHSQVTFALFKYLLQGDEFRTIW